MGIANIYCDVVVVGGGPTGCFTAARIAGSCFSVLLVEEHMLIGLNSFAPVNEERKDKKT